MSTSSVDRNSHTFSTLASSTLAFAALGFPRIGPKRELKVAVESYWAGRTDAGALQAEAARRRAANWEAQRQLGAATVAVNDFSLYDHVLDTTAMVGAIPSAYGWRGGEVPLDTYFAMARGNDAHSCNGHVHSVPALEMTKWFDTNYHYVVPQLAPRQSFELSSTKVVDEFIEARGLGYQPRPVLLGPVTYLLLSKSTQPGTNMLSLLPGLLPVYAEVLRRLAAAGANWVQIDEPCLALDLDGHAHLALSHAYEVLWQAAPQLKLLLTSYFSRMGDNLDTALNLSVAGLHLDMVRAPEEASIVAQRARRDLVLSLGVVDGRNIWRTDLTSALNRVESIVGAVGLPRVMLAPSCSLLHVPVDLSAEDGLDPTVRSWLAFAVQKLGELKMLTRAVNEGRSAVADELKASDAATRSRQTSPLALNRTVRQRIAAIIPDSTRRRSAYAKRREVQAARLSLPMYPTTTIGSFPQTEAVRKARAAHAKGTLTDGAYDAFLRAETRDAIRWQEEIGLDVLVHGEFERNDMVQYFGEQLEGYAFTQHAWVQSYGSRCVRPPIIFGDVWRPKPMTVAWSQYAQSLTDRVVKGMLTGPVTMLQWSFVRDDLPRSEVCRQIALAIRDEVADLERAGIRIVQIDEPALREGLPLKQADRAAYLDWSVECFRLASAGVADETQIHTHMCYAEFNDIIASIAALDADVISIETARSRMELLEAFNVYRYPNQIGPGVYDIHAPRCPTVEEMIELIRTAALRLPHEQIWINPDCGLKTRRWEEVRPALANMVKAAAALRSVESKM